MNSDKPELRRRMREMLREMPGSEKIDGSRSLVAQIVQSGIWKAAQCVMLFYPLPGEPDLRELWQHPKRLCLPRMDGEMLRVHEVKSLGAFTGSLDSGGHPAVLTAELDLVLVPGLAFTREGVRLGRGGGHFDRFLATTSALKAGVCFSSQLVASIPTEPHDIRMDHIFVSS